MTLADAMPYEFFEQYQNSAAYKLRDVEVVRVHNPGDEGSGYWPGPHKHVVKWVELENGKAVGWNENPARGWSFPVINLRKI